jgi:hypothetical protein
MLLRAVNMLWDVTPYSRFGETCPLNLQGPPSALNMSLSNIDTYLPINAGPTGRAV